MLWAKVIFGIEQVYKGIPIYGSEMILHTKEAVPYLLNGRNFPTPKLDNLTPSISKNEANQIALQTIESEEDVKELTDFEKQLISGNPANLNWLVIHPEKRFKKPKIGLAYPSHSNIAAKWAYFIDANSGEILKSYSELCKFHAHKPLPPKGNRMN